MMRALGRQMYVLFSSIVEAIVVIWLKSWKRNWITGGQERETAFEYIRTQPVYTI